MSQQLPAIIVVLPLVACFFIFFSGWWVKSTGYFLAVGVLAACLLLALGILRDVTSTGALHYALGGWPPPWGIAYRIDHLNALMLVLVSALSLLAAIHAKRLVARELPEKTALFWCLYILLITGLLGICATGDLFNLFVMLEVASLAGYALIAMGEKGAVYASFRYLVMGTIGACFYLQGVGYLYMMTGSLNIADLSKLLPGIYQSRVIFAGFAFMLIGLSIKLALFPLHAWLPDAYTRAPSAVSAVIAPLMTKVMAYVIIRVTFTLFDARISLSIFHGSAFMVGLGTLAIVFGGLMALSQTDYKRMLSYVIIAEIGFIVGGIGTANAIALQGAVFHIINDATMMACLFLVAGLVVHRTDGHRIADFKGIFKTMPLTAAVFTIAALAVIGVPPTCGFFSKWYLLLGGIKAHQWGFVAALLVCTLINVALFFRIIDKGLYVHHDHATAAPDKGLPDTPKAAEAPLTMLLPAVVLAIAILLMGIFNQQIMDKVIRFTIPQGL